MKGYNLFFMMLLAISKIKAPTGSKALCQSVIFQVNRVIRVMVCRSYRLFEDDLCRSFFFSLRGKMFLK
jgi:hypothetical protein